MAEHHTDIKEYTKRFGYKGVGFSVNVGTLPHQDPRYIRWRKSLFKRPPPWSKGYTKETHPSVAKISETFRKRKIDNFTQWRSKAKKLGLIPASYPPLSRNRMLAFLIGLVLGDGHIARFPRTHSLQITLGTDKPLLWQYAAEVLKEIFRKEPHIGKRQRSACVDVRIYQKFLDQRLGIPAGDRGKILIRFPQWIRRNKTFLISCLKGLFEAEGSFSIHLKTYTYNLSFSNRNISLLNEVESALKGLGFHPERRKDAVRLRRKDEAYRFQRLISFRKYPTLYAQI